MKKEYLSPEFFVEPYDLYDSLLNSGDVDGDIIGWDPDAEGF